MKRPIKQSSAKQTTLSPLFKLAKVDSDPKFKEMLEVAKEEQSFKAPESLRVMLVNLQPLNWGLSCGYSYRDGKHVLTWFISDFGAKGTPEEVVSRISEPLLNDGFEMTKKPDYTFSSEYAKASGSILQKCTIQRVARFVGSREPRAGGYLLFEAELEEPGDRMTVAQVLDAYPELRCPDVPQVYMDFVSSRKATSVDYGGTYIVYYDWSTTLACEDEEAAAAMLEEMKNLAVENGGVLDDREVDRGVYTYFQPETARGVFIRRGWHRRQFSAPTKNVIFSIFNKL